MIKESQKLLFKMDNILDMIAKCNGRIKQTEKDLINFEHPYSYVRLAYKSIDLLLAELKKNEDIKYRLQCYYLTNLTELGTIFLHKFKN